MNRYHILYQVVDDAYLYCVDISADSAKEAAEILAEMEPDLEVIVACREM